MDQVIRDAIALVRISETKIRGTGFVVAEDLVATALHVVAERTNPPTFYPGKIRLTFPRHTIDAEIIEGAWSTDADWVLLKCAEPPECRPIPLRDLESSGGQWETFGFPDANPGGGMVLGGEVRNERAQLDELDKIETIQLFCVEAAAGNGAPVRGLSGAPVIVGDAAVGLLRFALLEGIGKQSRSVAGTVYACKAATVVTGYQSNLRLQEPALDPHVVRINGPDGCPVGVGCLLANRRIVTCAHVIAAALGDQKFATGNKPEGTVRVQFPLSNVWGQTFEASVTLWQRLCHDSIRTLPKHGLSDLALLELTSDPPDGSIPAPLNEELDISGQDFESFGFPGIHYAGWQGRPLHGQIEGRIGPSWFWLEPKYDTSQGTLNGFSGAPVFVN